MMEKPANPVDTLPGIFASAFEYLVDSGQRSVLFMDVMRQRGEQYREHLSETVPHVLNYEVELIADGRNLKRPVITAWCGSSLQPASRSTPRSAPLSSSTRVPVTVRESAASRPIARSGSP